MLPVRHERRIQPKADHAIKQIHIFVKLVHNFFPKRVSADHRGIQRDKGGIQLNTTGYSGIHDTAGYNKNILQSTGHGQL